MTGGKFTQHVHDLGYLTGRSLHRVLVRLSTLYGDNQLLEDHDINILEGDSSFILSSLPFSTTSSTPLLLRTLFSTLFQFFLSLPSRYIAWWTSLLHSDPLHVLVETLLIVMCIALVLLQRRTDWKFRMERKKGAPTVEEEEELISEWKMEKRMALGAAVVVVGGRRRGRGGGEDVRLEEKSLGESTLIVDKIEGSKLFFVSGDSKLSASSSSSSELGVAEVSTIAGSSSSSSNDTSEQNSNIPSAINFATFDYLSSSSSHTLRKVAKHALAHYGCGSCGPRGFYGTIDAHLEVEDAMSSFLHADAAILYSDGASASTSTVAAFAKRGDLLIVDEGVHEALLVGVTLSRANVRYFRHNNVKDLRRVLEKVAAQDALIQRKPTDQRRFLVVEGLYRNYGTICPLDEIVKLKEEFHYRLILDDSYGMGCLGKNGRGTLEHYGLRPMRHAEIVTFSLENALGSVGGMTVGNEEVVDHQRLSGAGYCFSASAPPFLSKVCLASVRRLEGKMDEMMKEIKGGGEDDVVPKDRNLSESTAAAAGDWEVNYNEMTVANLKIELKKRGLGVTGRKAELQERLKDFLTATANDDKSASTSIDELSGPALLERLHQNVGHLYRTLTNPSHPHALKLRNRLVITSHPQSPVIYLRLSDDEAIGRTQHEQISILDRISHYCLTVGKVAIVSTGGHVKRYLQLVPEPGLRMVVNVSQTLEDVEMLVKALGDAVESALGDAAESALISQ
ncbi:hypothetical protein ACHAWU_006628 [Discostella pseudostelligera]|uniref:serine C-palmitoyltransferase n=1 Tax=Discostella pseudostelligera TaxID=259834 RepID=A0ABD3MHR1_9STRA